MAKQEYEGVAFTSGVKDGWQVSVTERAESSAEAVANLEATIALMKDDGYSPFVSYYNKSEAVVGAPEDILTEDIAGLDSPFAPSTVVDLAKELGGVEPSPQMIEDAFPKDAVPVGDSMYLGIKVKKPKVAECPQGYSYEIVVNSYSADEKEIRFYNEHSDYPACTHNWKSDFGKEKFAEIFPNWTPQRGSKIKLTTPVKLFVKGEGTTSEGNAYQNLKSAEQA